MRRLPITSLGARCRLADENRKRAARCSAVRDLRAAALEAATPDERVAGAR